MAKGSDKQADPAREGVEHLEAAAREMIAAARSMLDACEELLGDPRAGEMVASFVGSVARAVNGFTGIVRPPKGTDGGEGADGDDGGDGRPSVQRIKIS